MRMRCSERQVLALSGGVGGTSYSKVATVENRSSFYISANRSQLSECREYILIRSAIEGMRAVTPSLRPSFLVIVGIEFRFETQDTELSKHGYGVCGGR
jgi:hypothetical protein